MSVGMSSITGLDGALTARALSSSVATPSDVTTTSGVAANLTGLLFPLLANTSYMGQFHVRFQSNNLLTGLSLGFTGPAMAQPLTSAVRIPGATPLNGILRGVGSLVSAIGIDIINVDTLAIIEFSLRTTAAGNLQVQFARNGIAGTITAKAGCHGVLFTVAT